MQEICIFRLSAIGDVVMTVPMVRALQATFPKANITWLIGRAAHSLVEGLSGVNFIVIDKPSSPLAYWRFYRQMAGLKFDVLIAMQASLRANLMYPLIKAKRKIGFDKARAKDGHQFFITESVPAACNHLLEAFMSFAVTAGATKPQTPSWQLAISQQHYADTQAYKSKPYIIINPAASKVERNWPTENYIQLIQRINHQYPDIEIFLTGSEQDKALCQQISQSGQARVLAGQTSLKQLAALLDDAICLIAPDTGPVHIATAMNTAVIGLYAVITAKLSGPYLSQQLVIDKYQQAVATILEDDPNTIAWGKRVHTNKAMALITVDDVLEKFKLLL